MSHPYDPSERKKRKRSQRPTEAMERMAEQKGVTITPRAHTSESSPLRGNKQYERQARYSQGQYPVKDAAGEAVIDRILRRILGVP